MTYRTLNASLRCYLLGLWPIIIHDTERDYAQTAQLLFASDNVSLHLLATHCVRRQMLVQGPTDEACYAIWVQWTSILSCSGLV